MENNFTAPATVTVAELIIFLATLLQETAVVYACHSERVLLSLGQVKIIKACLPRPDGWVQSERPDMPSQSYLALPGN